MAVNVYKDRVKCTTTTTGTGTLTLGSAATGFQGFSALTTGDQCTFCTEDGTNWEVAEGIYTTSGTTLSRATIIASSNSGSAVSWGAGTKNVFLVLSARDVSAAQLGVTALYNGTTGTFASTMGMADITAANIATVNGRLHLNRLSLPRGRKVSNILFYSGTTAGATLANQWAVLTDIDGNVRAISADDTSTAWAANAQKIFAMTTPYTIPSEGVYYAGLMVKAGTQPSVCGNTTGVFAAGTPHMLPPILCGGTTATNLTNPASCLDPVGAITANTNNHVYAEVS